MSDQWLWGQSDPQHAGMLRVGPNRQMMLSMIDKMAIGDMPDFDPGMKKATVGLAGCTDAAVKHMIMISDGDPASPPQSTINALIQGRRHGHDRAGGRPGPFAERQGGHAEHRHAMRRQVFHRPQFERAAEDFPARSPARRTAARVRAESAGHSADLHAA